MTTQYAFLGGQLYSDASQVVARKIELLVDAGVTELHLGVNSTGGEVAEGIAIYRLLRGSHFDLIAYNIGSVHSISLLPYLAADRRFASETSSFLLHPAGTQTSEYITHQRALELAQQCRVDDDSIERLLQERTNLEGQDLRRRRFGTWTLDAAEAMTHGIAHEQREFDPPGGTVIALYPPQRV